MTPEQSGLLDIYAALAPAERKSLLDYAEFLRARAQPAVVRQDAVTPDRAAPQVPQPLPRPEQETVIAALKRLSTSYPMLDRSTLLNATSGLVTQHIMQGRTPTEVIDELEIIFVRHYESWRDKE